MATPFLHEDEAFVGQTSIERLFPGLNEDSTEHPALSAGQACIGSKRSVNVARPAHLGALVAAKPRILNMIRGAQQQPDSCQNNLC